MGKRQCLNMSMKIRLFSQPACLSWGHELLRALLILTWSLTLYPLQAGAEGRDGESCGTVGLLLEHSFEIGESNNVLAWTLTQNPAKSGCHAV